VSFYCVSRGLQKSTTLRFATNFQLHDSRIDHYLGVSGCPRAIPRNDRELPLEMHAFSDPARRQRGVLFGRKLGAPPEGGVSGRTNRASFPLGSPPPSLIPPGAPHLVHEVPSCIGFSGRPGGRGGMRGMTACRSLLGHPREIPGAVTRRESSPMPLAPSCQPQEHPGGKERVRRADSA
jgi:hypothetical protein